MKKTALLFGGQGLQFVGMGKKMYESSEKVRDVFDISSEVAEYNMADLCFRGPTELLNRTEYSQLSILTVEIAMYEIFKDLNINFDAVAGLSLGEYAALYAAGVITLKDIFELVKKRAIAMEREISDDVGRMIAVINCNIDILDHICHSIGLENCCISNYNSCNQITISFKRNYYDILVKKIHELGGIVIPLKVNRPFHHQLMKPAADAYLNTLSNFSFEKPSKPLYLNTTGKVYDNKIPLTDILYKQVFSPVLWYDAINGMLDEGITKFYEISPKKVLCSLIKNSCNDKIETIDVSTLF